jgi:acyl carrier protein
VGLDRVELVMRFEEAFGLALKDEEATETVTPRMVIGELGLPDADYTEDSRFIEDFNMD